jgi:hypothetical protein
MESDSWLHKLVPPLLSDDDLWSYGTPALGASNDPFYHPMNLAMLLQSCYAAPDARAIDFYSHLHTHATLTWDHIVGSFADPSMDEFDFLAENESQCTAVAGQTSTYSQVASRTRPNTPVRSAKPSRKQRRLALQHLPSAHKAPGVSLEILRPRSSNQTATQVHPTTEKAVQPVTPKQEAMKSRDAARSPEYYGCYDTLIDAPAKAGLPAEAEKGLRYLITEYLSGRTKFEPNTRCFTRVLVAWQKFRSRPAPERVAALVRDMFAYSDSGQLRCQPDTSCIEVRVQLLAPATHSRHASRTHSPFH